MCSYHYIYNKIRNYKILNYIFCKKTYNKFFNFIFILKKNLIKIKKVIIHNNLLFIMHFKDDFLQLIFRFFLIILRNISCLYIYR